MTDGIFTSASNRDLPETVQHPSGFQKVFPGNRMSQKANSKPMFVTVLRVGKKH